MLNNETICIDVLNNEIFFFGDFSIDKKQLIIINIIIEVS